MAAVQYETCTEPKVLLVGSLTGKPSRTLLYIITSQNWQSYCHYKNHNPIRYSGAQILRHPFESSILCLTLPSPLPRPSLLSGNEEVPEGAVAVLTSGDCPDVLSHSAVRARNMGVLMAACLSDEVRETAGKGADHGGDHGADCGGDSALTR